jgi:hypothetical protein
MLRSVFVAAAAAVLLAVGALSAVAGNAHGKAGGTLATTTTLRGEATSELKSTTARPNANAAPAATQAQTQAQAETDTDTETADESADVDTDDATQANDDQAAAAPAAAPAGKTEQEGSGHDD